MIETRTGDRFVDDVKSSVAAWRHAPLLPIVAALLVVIELPSYDVWTPAVILPIGFFAIGWLGTQLIWYQRAFDGRGSNPRELIPLTWGFVARYFWLVGLASIPIFVVFIPLAITKVFTADSLRSPDSRIGLFAYVAVVQMVGTFMVPALAFSTRKVTRAIPVGLRMIAQGWPGNWRYVVVPGFIAAALGGVYWLVPSPVRPALDILTTLISLVFAGAIARYYLRTKTRESHDSGTVTG
jgi:hypothetical protein